MNRIYLIALFFILGLSLKAQENKTFQEYLFSYNFTNKYKEGKQFKGSAEFKINSPHEFNYYSFFGSFQSLNKNSDEFINFRNLRPRHWVYGVGFYYTDQLYSRDRFELRFMQGTSFYFKTGQHSSIKNFIRIEERFQRSMGDGEWSDGYRFRYKLSSAIPLGELLFDFSKGLYMPVSLEAFVNLQKTDRFNDVIRLSFGLGYKINPRWKVEADLVYKRTQDQGFNINSDNFLFRLRVFNTFKKGRGLIFKNDELLDLIEDQ